MVIGTPLSTISSSTLSLPLILSVQSTSQFFTAHFPHASGLDLQRTISATFSPSRPLIRNVSRRGNNVGLVSATALPAGTAPGRSIKTFQSPSLTLSKSTSRTLRPLSALKNPRQLFSLHSSALIVKCSKRGKAGNVRMSAFNLFTTSPFTWLLVFVFDCALFVRE